MTYSRLNLNGTILRIGRMLLYYIIPIRPQTNQENRGQRAQIANAKVAVAALPFAFATIFKKAYGQTILVPVNTVLNFALQLEYLESNLYNKAVASTGLIAVTDVNAFTIIQANENEHVTFLKSLLGSAAIPTPVIDLTAKGAFPDVLINYNTFLAVSNALEDTGVRAYKGQAPNLVGNQTVLTAALSIHAIEARHASAVRQIRASHGVSITPWITGSAGAANDTGIVAVNANYGAGASGYAAENNVMQEGIDVTTLASVYGSKTPYNVGCEAFDEPLDMNTVLSIVAPFFG